MRNLYDRLRHLVARVAGPPHPRPGGRPRTVRPRVEALEERQVPCAPLPPLLIQFPNGIGPEGFGGPKGTPITITTDMVPSALHPSEGTTILLNQPLDAYLQGLKGVNGAGGELELNPGSENATQPAETVHVRLKLVTVDEDGGKRQAIELVLDGKVELPTAPQFGRLKNVVACLRQGRRGPHVPRPHGGFGGGFGGFGGGVGGFGAGNFGTGS